MIHFKEEDDRYDEDSDLEDNHEALGQGDEVKEPLIFQMLYPDALKAVLNYTSVQDVHHFSCVNRYAKNLIDNKHFWQARLKEHHLPFPDEPCTKQLFIQAYQTKAVRLIQEINYFKAHKGDILMSFSQADWLRKLTPIFRTLENLVPKIYEYDVNLHELDIYLQKLNNIIGFAQIPAAPSQHVKLQHITRFNPEWIDKYCEKFPQNEQGAVRLSFLDLKDTGITCLPENIDRLKYISSLWMYDTRLDSLPDCLKNLEYLDHMNISGGHFESIPPVVFECKNLISLCLVDMGIKDISHDILKLERLGVLYLQENKLEHCPKSLYLLPSLMYLVLDKNNLKCEQPEFVHKLYERLHQDLSAVLRNQKGSPRLQQLEAYEDVEQLTLALDALSVQSPVLLSGGPGGHANHQYNDEDKPDDYDREKQHKYKY